MTIRAAVPESSATRSSARWTPTSCTVSRTTSSP